MEWFYLAMTLRPFFLVLMLAIFLGIFLWAYAPRRRGILEDQARIPFRDDRNI